MLGMPSGPGALYGLSLPIWPHTCSAVSLVVFLHCGGYRSSTRGSVSAGLAGKNALVSALLFSPFVLAVRSCPPMVCFRGGILALPPSVAGTETSLLVVQMSGSSTFSSQSLQCCFLVYCRVLSYLFAASLCSVWTL